MSAVLLALLFAQTPAAPGAAVPVGAAIAPIGRAIAPAPPSSPAAAGPDRAREIVAAALLERGSFDFARGLADDVGARPAGSKAAERAVIWAEDAMKRAGLTGVHREPVTTRHWVRGPISVTLRADATVPAAIDQPLTALALGGSVATPEGGVEGDVVEVDSLEAIAALGPAARGAIVFMNKSVTAAADGSGYGPVARLRGAGPSAAARVGARAYLIRSAATGHHGLAHTGALRYEEGVTQIPAAALSVEDAELLARRVARKSKTRVHIVLQAQELGPTPSSNVVGELRGTSKTVGTQIVLLGAHLDSWDVGRGAIDDGAGCGIALDTARVMARLHPGPARTVRVVLFMSEEIDGTGAAAYAKTHQAELGRHVAAIEADSGAGRPYRYGVVAGGNNQALVTSWVRPLGALVPATVEISEHAGADVGPLQREGVPVLSVGQDHTRYFDWHHTLGDTVDKIDPDELALATAAHAQLVWSLANAKDTLTRTAPAAASSR